jgi:hypothetical protein
MPKDLPAVLPLRPKTELPVAATTQTAAPPATRANTVAPAGPRERTLPAGLPSMTIRRSDLAAFVRFGPPSRVTLSRKPAIATRARTTPQHIAEKILTRSLT